MSGSRNETKQQQQLVVVGSLLVAFPFSSPFLLLFFSFFVCSVHLVCFRFSIILLSHLHANFQIQTGKRWCVAAVSFKQREMRFNFEFGCMHMWQCMCWVHVRYPRHTWTAMFIRELMQEGGRAPTRAQRREGKGTGLGRGREKKDRDRLALQLAAAIRPQYILGKVAAAGGSE